MSLPTLFSAFTLICPAIFALIPLMVKVEVVSLVSMVMPLDEVSGASAWNQLIFGAGVPEAETLMVSVAPAFRRCALFSFSS